MEYKNSLVGDIANMQAEIDRLDYSLTQLLLMTTGDDIGRMESFDDRCPIIYKYVKELKDENIKLKEHIKNINHE